MRLGPYLLDARIATGGMGQVWRGRHGRDGLEVAIKVLLPHADARYARLFADEVRAMAGLDHPGIAAVLDAGRVPADADAAVAAGLRAGAPFLVMELVDGAPLALEAALGWRDLAQVLGGLLDALAHAHARGVVHRDLKPGNVLRTPDGRVKLTDFGIAHALDRLDTDTPAAGTPAYMAPEQAHGLWRDFGPWTDLYAVGCLAHAMAAGVPPFGGASTLGVVRAHLEQPPPALAPRMAVPAGFAHWVTRSMQKDPAARFQRAADARAALDALGPPVEGGRADAVAVAGPAVTLAYGVRAPTVGEYARTPMVDGRASPGAPAASPKAIDIPDTPEARFEDSAVALFGLRLPPLVGRSAACRALWGALLEVARDEAPRLVLLRGAAGAGKSRLAAWLVERAHAEGAATGLRALHPAGAEAGAGLADMLARHLRLGGLNRAAAAARVRGVLREGFGVDDADEAEALAELVVPATADDRATGERFVQLAGAVERHGVVLRHLARLAVARPVVVWLDDVQWDAEAVAFADAILRRGAGRVLVVATARAEALAERPRLAEQLDAVLALPGARALDVEPLGEAAVQRLVRTLLPVERGLARDIAERSAGNPAFAVQLAQACVERGLLDAGADGLRLSGAALPALPADLEGAWAERVDRLLTGRPVDDAVALELAATLGQVVEPTAWHAACAEARAWFSPALLEALLDRRLAVVEDADTERWAFAHGLLRDAVLRRATQAGRAAAHHAVCARVVGAEQPERQGRHLLAAGDARGALEALGRAGEDALERGEFLRCEALIEDYERARRAAAVGDDDPRAGVALWLRAGVALGRGAFAEAGRYAERLERLAVQHGWRALEAEALLQRSRVDFDEARFADGHRHVERALARLPAEARPALRGELLRSAGNILLAQGQLREADVLIAQAQDALERVGQVAQAARCEKTRATIARQDGRLDDAARYLDRARDEMYRLGLRLAEGDTLHGAAELARLRGDLDAAERDYRAAHALYEAVGSSYTIITQINLGLVLIERGRHVEAGEVLGRCLAVARRERRTIIEIVVQLFLLPSLAVAGDWATFDRWLADAHAFLEARRICELDQARMAAEAARLCAERGQPARARRAWALAADQYRMLGRGPDADACAAEASG
ncbi:MAG: protein kinase [Myxococcales bacterium]|nr:protein kinase [Myxococcales bacterium]